MINQPDDKAQEGIYALVSGAGSMITKDGLGGVILVERQNLKRGVRYKTTIYGISPAVVLIKDPDSLQWHFTGPEDQLTSDDLFKLAEGLKEMAEKRSKGD